MRKPPNLDRFSGTGRETSDICGIAASWLDRQIFASYRSRMPNIFIYWNDLTGEWDAYGLEIATANQTPQLHQIVSTDRLLSVFTTLSIVDRDNALNIFAVAWCNGIDKTSIPLHPLLAQNITLMVINPS